MAPDLSAGTSCPPGGRDENLLPMQDAGLSYWHRSTRAFPLLHENRNQPPPLSAKYVVVGSGLTGALVAFNLIQRGIPPTEIIILEAREAVSGSTGRNAGHVRPDAFRNFCSYQAAHGARGAMDIVTTETQNLSLVTEFVRRHNIECDLRLTTTFDVCLSTDAVQDVEKNIQAFVSAGGSLAELNAKCWYGLEAEQVTRCVEALAAYEWPAASVHPAKLVHWILQYVVERGSRLYTHCPAVSVVSRDDLSWQVMTPRGAIQTNTVIHCTNAYAASLLKSMDAPRLAPLAIQAVSIVPGPSWSSRSAFNKTMAIRESPTMFYGLAQMPSDGTVIVSIGRPIGKGVQAEDDHSPEAGRAAMQRLNQLFPAEHDGQIRSGEGLDCSWSGLIAFTPDKVPYVGELSELPRQYICAGFNGHGMANIFSCASGVVGLILGQSWDETSLPACYRYSQNR